jgi:small subunit ribosomal protein S16
MAVSIRLRREGAKNRPYFKVVVADSRSPRDGKFIEIIGTYDPKKQGDNSTLKLERAEYWLARGAQASDTVKSLIKKNKKRPTGAGVADVGPRSATAATTDAGSPPETAAATIPNE